MKIQVSLPRDRQQLGTLTALDAAGNQILGPVSCLGKSDEEYATLHDNPVRDPLKRGGDLPYGTYSCTVERFDPPRPTEVELHSYGQYGKIHLFATGGDAAIACGPLNSTTGVGGRDGLCAHGGQLNPIYTQWGGRRPTHGCLRLLDEDVLTLMTEMAALPEGEKADWEVTAA